MLKLWQGKTILRGLWTFILHSGKVLISLGKRTSDSSQSLLGTPGQKDHHPSKGLGNDLQETFCYNNVIGEQHMTKEIERSGCLSADARGCATLISPNNSNR